MFVLISNRFKQQLCKAALLTENEDETPLSHIRYHHDVFQFVCCGSKVREFYIFFSGFKTQRLFLFESLKSFYTRAFVKISCDVNAFVCILL